MRRKSSSDRFTIMRGFAGGMLHVLAGHADFHAADVARQVLRVIGYGASAEVESAGRGPRLLRGARPHRATLRAERADMVEGTGEGRQTVTGNAAVGGAHPYHSAKRRWLADRAAGIGSKRDHGCPLCHHRRRTAARAAGDAIQRHGIAHRPEALFSFEEPMANSSQLVLPRMTPPALRCARQPWHRRVECSFRASSSRRCCGPHGS